MQTVQSAPEAIAADLRSQLLDGRIHPGTWLRELELCERYGVGRHTVRSALSLLVSARLLVREANRGVRVPELTRERVDELFTFRAAIEMSSLRIALTEGVDLSAVHATVEQMARLPEDASWEQLTEAHARIHAAVVAASGNDRLIAAHRACADELRLMLASLRPELRRETLIELHVKLAEGLSAGGETALDALRTDIDDSGRAMLLRLLHHPEGEHEHAE